ncbi:MAG: hypothetical protein CM15mP103_07540 [Gammaproteobacteria bacterium]|nr:MAG: hypothetical protein CM15mP103_07540 [Gammaproteobacteria bacterium]
MRIGLVTMYTPWRRVIRSCWAGQIPCERGLIAHPTGCGAACALDALGGAAGLGISAGFFPDTDPGPFSDADSRALRAVSPAG